MSRRAEQFASTIHQALQELISRGLQDPRISGLITVTSVEVSPDLKTAFVQVSVLPADRQDLTMHGLRSAAKHLRHVLGEKIATRAIPALEFRLDTSLKKQAGVFEALSRVREEQERKGAGGDASAVQEETGDGAEADAGDGGGGD
jgi:ribosome-binding factor A